MTPSTSIRPEDEVVDICRELIAIDTSNYGDGSGPGERAAADYVDRLFREVGLEPEIVESEPGRASLVVRIPGADRERGALCVHGHLDVVPANAEDWDVDPFEGVERDGMIWGRGAVDMKDMDAMIIACVRHIARQGITPPRDLVIALFADEEAGGKLGSHHLVEHRPDLFEGVTEAVSEVGGYSVTVPTKDGGEKRAYLLQTAEKGILWLRLTANGRAGHGSVPNDENAVARLAEALSRLAAHKWPREFIPSVRTLLDRLSEITGVTWSDEDLDELLENLGGAQGFVRGTLQDTSNPTMLDAGYKHNVIPQQAHANVDCRFLPGHEEELMATITDLVGEHVTIEVIHRDIALDAPFEGPLVEAMVAALQTEDPEAEVLPYCLSGGTDNKALSLLGITGYGFAPLRLPADLDFAPMFHGINERVPVDSLKFGARVLQRFIETS
ncbi:acetylornithine deacetylase/succinyl-diaminopimelate desuccinylase-like protein [Knoellia remsis]|uniref:Acetylornithine deacetylase/succinyl-diaminopimelate desuccinylase-like protein n=1 Tax=Knoellia remsis TaxID=407159 RepID=A0A2T0UAB7_9MICO|nr:M20/M25/M40 family metallo-hydrolase [Knoellia remsis]PRY54885.1 acetylornithine deacetylase/succinyl-diaminopimelate desuccinylase-like protein [Knoellia remsis]